VDRVKLSPEISRSLRMSDERRGIAHTLVTLLHLHGFGVVAGGVEDRADGEVLRVIGCDLVQGHAYARPMAEDALVSWLGDHRRVANG
jgi:EAL domain-containing protein (putative c-di-GMP-specific phosphodiesterase class I)